MLALTSIEPLYDHSIDLCRSSEADMDSGIVGGAVGVTAGDVAMQDSVFAMNLELGTECGDPIKIVKGQGDRGAKFARLIDQYLRRSIVVDDHDV